MKKKIKLNKIGKILTKQEQRMITGGYHHVECEFTQPWCNLSVVSCAQADAACEMAGCDHAVACF